MFFSIDFEGKINVIRANKILKHFNSIIEYYLIRKLKRKEKVIHSPFNNQIDRSPQVKSITKKTTLLVLGPILCILTRTKASINLHQEGKFCREREINK